MGSKFFDIHHIDPTELWPWLRGDVPDLVETLYAREEPPAEELRGAFETMAEHLMIFMPKDEHADGIMYARAVEYLLVMLGSERTGVEFYFESAADDLVFERCEAHWLAGVVTEYGPGSIRYRGPKTCRMYMSSLSRYASDANPTYLSAADARAASSALSSAWHSGHGAFIIYQA